MAVLTPAIATAFATSLVLVLVYVFLYKRHQEEYLYLWTLSWSVYVLRYAFEMAAVSGTVPSLMPVAQGIVLFSAYLMLRGSATFVGNRLHGFWLFGVAAAVGWLLLASAQHQPFPWLALPAFGFAACVRVYTGWLLLRTGNSLGSGLAGWAFIAWGLHQANYPFLQPHASFAPYGYLIGSMLGTIAAVGLLLVFYERTAETLRESEERYAALFESSRSPMVLIEPESGFVVDANPAALEFYGFPLEQLRAMRISDINQLDSEEVAAAMAQARRSKREAFQFQHRLADGRVREVEVHSSPVRLRGRTLLYSIIHDVTDRVRAEEAQQLSEERFRTLFRHAGDGIFLLDADGRLLDVNPAMEALLGYERTSLLGEPVLDFVHPGERDAAADSLAVLAQGQRRIRERHFVHRSGRAVPVEVSGTPLPDGRVLSIVRDVTERREAEQALRTSHQVLEQVLASLRDAVVVVNPYTRVIERCNPAAEEVFGYSREELLGRDTQFLHINGPLFQRFGREVLDAVNDQGYFASDFTMRRRNGEAFPTEHYAVPLFDGEGRLVSVVHVVRDLTQQREAEAEREELTEQLRQAQKMEAVGQLAGGVAHDFNNVLTVVVGHCDMLAEELTGRQHASIMEMRRAAERASALTQQLLTFSRKHVTQARLINPTEVLRETEAMLQRLIGSGVRTDCVVEPQLGMVLMDPGHLEQVIVNLAVNARDAMPEGGRLLIEAGNVELDEDYLRRHPEASAGPHVMLSVSDTGSGMDEDTLRRMYEPFFTTKPEGKGTGLGLATVFGIVTQAGGHINCYSEPGHGTTFRLYLPRVQEGDERAPTRDHGAQTGGSETILLVEDEDPVRALSRRILEGHGYRVLAAAGADEAMRICRDEREPIHLLLTDVIMPGQNGRELAEQFVQHRPDVPVLFMSGHPGGLVTGEAGYPGDEPFLQKPFAAAALVKKVRELLDA